MATRQVATKLSPKTTALLLCDMQEKFRNTVGHFKEILEVSRRVLVACNKLDMKIIATEQYPKGQSVALGAILNRPIGNAMVTGLGRTVSELGLTDVGGVEVVEKTSFSMCVPRVVELLRGAGDVKSVLLCGIEGHACVYQTGVDLLHEGYDVHVVVDAVSSRSQVDRMFAFRQLERQGALLTTSECAILALLRDAKHPQFREIQKLIMQTSPDSQLLGPSRL